jgi:hypothetical protein
MQKTDMSLASEFRVSPLWVLVTLPVLGLAFYALGEQLVDARELLPYALFALLMYGLAAGGWMLYRWHAEIGRWYAIVISGVAVFLGHFWLGIPGVLALVAVPPAVAVGVIGFAAALGIAVLETALLIVLRGFGALQVTAIGVPLITLWATFGALLAVHLPAREAAQWAWDYFQSARKLLEEARDRQGRTGPGAGRPGACQSAAHPAQHPGPGPAPGRRRGPPGQGAIRCQRQPRATHPPSTW